MFKKKLRWKYLKINFKIKLKNLNFSLLGHPMGALVFFLRRKEMHGAICPVV